MKPLLASFGVFIRQITRDNMLWAVCFAPLLTALIFRFGVPYVDALLCAYFDRAVLLADYYLLFDLWLCLTPSYMACFASAMVLLAERDENMAAYMAVTPVGKTGYMLSRLILPASLAFFFAMLLTHYSSLTDWDLPVLAAVSLVMSLASTAAALLIFSFSRNKVEGMAMAKIASLLFLGLVAPFFLSSKVQYLAGFLPTFWAAKLAHEKSSLYLFPALVISLLWIGRLSTRFRRKLC
ncbi:MAG: ABC transporter permease [Firmicutes bacterium]|nr:ABC transporter permease [Bacillota bacterium]